MQSRLDSYANEAALARQFTAKGLSDSAAQSKAKLFARCAETLAKADVAKDADVRAFFVPGRIEVLGKHTDYAGGRSLVVAVEQGFCLLAAPRAEAALGGFAVDLGLECEFPFRGDIVPPVGPWSNYPMTVARRVARNFPGTLRGATVAFASDLPSAAGMSSSSALMVAWFHALAAINGLAEREEYRRNISGPESLAEYLGTVENGQTFGTLVGDKGVGTFGGSEDHTAMLCCEPGTLRQYSFRPVRLERKIPMPAGHVFAIGSSGVVAEKTGDAMEKYNRASRRAMAVAKVWCEATGRTDPHMAAVLASGPLAATVERMRGILARWPGDGTFSREDLATRFEQFLGESVEVIPAAGGALAAGDLAAFGRLVDRSQELGVELLGNQIPETQSLAESARALGAAAASAFGAGFGGSVWAMVEESRAETFMRDWAEHYRQAFPEPATRAAFFATRAGPAAFELGV